MIPKYYTGIGSRSTPPAVLEQMRHIAVDLSDGGYILRSGGADGADSAFESGARSPDIYLPWKGFNGKQGIVVADMEPAMALAAQYHPAWAMCSVGAKKLHARNMYQVLGQNLSVPSEFVICWTKDGSGKGGTGQAIRLAKAHGVPVYDMGHPDFNITTFYDAVL